MRRLSGRSRSALIIGLQGIRARKLRTLLSMVSLFLGVLAVVVVQAGASIAEKAMFADIDLQGLDGTKSMYVSDGRPEVSRMVLGVVEGRSDAIAMISTNVTIGEPGVKPVNPGGAPIGEDWGGGDPAAATRPAGQAIELRVTAVSGDVRSFRPYPLRTGAWLDFEAMPSLAPQLVLNEAAAKGFREHRVPAQMNIPGRGTPVTPRFIGVVKDGNPQPSAFVRLDELSRWLPAAAPNAQGGQPTELQVVLSATTPATRVLQSRLKGMGVEAYVDTVQSREEMEKQLMIVRLIFLSMAGLVLLIGVAGILNVGLASVGERIEEFALRRAVGTPRTLLAGIVLAETLLTGLFTAAVAIGVGAAGLRVVSMLFGEQEAVLQDVQFPWDAGVAGIIAGLIAGILGGAIPALRAAGIPIATVMRA